MRPPIGGLNGDLEELAGDEGTELLDEGAAVCPGFLSVDQCAERVHRHAVHEHVNLHQPFAGVVRTA